MATRAVSPDPERGKDGPLHPRDNATSRSCHRDRTREEFVICPLVAKEQLQGLIAVSSAQTLPMVEAHQPDRDVGSSGGTGAGWRAETFHARRSEARFQTLVQNASDVILIPRPDATITYQTPSATRNSGL